MAALKTQKTQASVKEYLATIEGADRRADAEAVCALMQEATGQKPAMWGSSIVGFGEYSYRYGKGESNDWPPVGFSSRKTALTIYIAEGVEPHAALLERLGDHKTGKGCVYIKRMSDVDSNILRKLVKEGFDQLNGKTITTSR